MLRSSVRRSSQLHSGITAGRQRLQGQFATMEGWQSGHSPRFDAYVAEKRRKQRFEGFDQRVERAFRSALQTHKAEVVNGFKRRLRSSGAKYTAEIMMELNQATEEREEWLRDVWAQIDADYRSEDESRQQLAAKEISAVLAGEPSEYMSWVYEEKRRTRGPKEQAELAEDPGASTLPSISQEEASRYHQLQLRMSNVEDNVKQRYGFAGVQHWAALQAEKDKAYEEKLDRAAEIYKKLLDQSSRYDESTRTALLRSHIARVHQAQHRFQASMALEKERESIMEAHNAMKEERQRASREGRSEALREAAELKAKGVSTPDIAQALRERQLQRHADRHAEFQLQEQERVLRHQRAYRTALQDFKSGVEVREGEELMAQANEESSDSLSSMNGPIARELSNKRQEQQRLAAKQRKSELWDAVNKNTHEDPFLSVHQARLDAASNYDSLYSKYFPTSLAQGKKYSRQGTGDSAAGNEMDKQVFQKSAFVSGPYQWGVQRVHDLDSDGSVSYLSYTGFHVQDKKTGDIDWRYEKKRGGPVFRGPRLYQIGAKREAKDPSEATMDPSFLTYREQQRSNELKAKPHDKLLRPPRVPQDDEA